MSYRPVTPHDDQAPEVVSPARANFNTYNSAYEYFLPQDSPAPEYVPQRSPAPEYQPYRDSRSLSSPSPRISANSPPPVSTSFDRTPSNSDNGFQHQRAPVQYSEFHSPDPERVYSPPPIKAPVPIIEEKEYYNKTGAISSAAPAPSLDHKPTIARKPVPQHGLVQPIVEQPRKKKPIYKRPLCIVAILVVLVIVVAAAVVGALLGSKKSKHNSTVPGNPTNSSVPTGDPDLAVGGYLSPSYYSTTGAWNGSGVALAAADPGVDQTIYVFYQDFQGNINYKLMEADGSFGSTLGLVNDPQSRPLNGTPISIVNTNSANKSIVYHLFYIDSDYYIVERTLQTGVVRGGSTIPTWMDGPLTSNKLQTLQSDTIGLQACLWNNYYGGYKSNSVYATDGIQLWYATTETSFAQYSWTNGTTTWNHDQDWSDLDGHAGVGCQTWESWMLEYVFFLDLNQNIVFYWRDNNQSAESTSTHPTLKWNKLDSIIIPNAQKSSSLGYTTYMFYQDADTSMRGANISWAAENTTIAVTSSGNLDVFTIDDLATNEPVPAVRGTHLTITSLQTASGGAELQVFFQSTGNDMSHYTRDMDRAGGLWQKAASVI